MATNPKQYKKMYRNEAKIHGKSNPELNKKRCLKTERKKTKKSPKMTPKWLPKSDTLLGKIPIGAPLVVQTVFVMKKLAPSAPKVRPRTKNKPKLPKNKQKMSQKLLNKQPRD